MARLGFFLAATVTVLAAVVDLASAGNPIWESGVRLQAPAVVRPYSVDARGYANTSSRGDTAKAKRWLIPQHLNQVRRWPDNTIRYCYETLEAQEALEDFFAMAQNEWADAGLEPDTFQYAMVANPGEDCINHADRASILVISHNDHGQLLTTIAIQPLDGRTPNYVGPRMLLSTVTNVGALDVVTNIAHELGHAWGLLHEHQDNTYWDAPAGRGLHDGGSPFQTAQFNCANLNDYAAKVPLLRDGDTVETLCSKYEVASKYGFSAAEWLPFPRQAISEAESLIDDGVDWESIMLYPSTAGGIGSAAGPGQGEAMDITDGRATVILGYYSLDGTAPKALQKFGFNAHPSDRDVEGIQEIYGEDSEWGQGTPVLPLDPNHPLNAQFNDAWLGAQGCI
jgi:hypothetical protein